MTPQTTLEHNRRAWEIQVEQGNPWTLPVDPETVAEAREGRWEIVLTPTRPVPRAWFGDLEGRRVLALASGGGQQGPILAAAGAEVTVFDACDRQLESDRRVSEREGLGIRTVQGDAHDLSAFEDGSFDLVINPVSVVFMRDARRVWAEAARVLAPGGAFLAGFGNPSKFIFDLERYEKEGVLELKYDLPYDESARLSPEEKARYLAEGEPLYHSHTLEDLIGGQLDAGLVITGFYEDRADFEDRLSDHMPLYMATRGVKTLGTTVRRL